jgi:hypothetical protein
VEIHKLNRGYFVKTQELFRVKNKLMGRNRITMKLRGAHANFMGFNYKLNYF